MYLKYPYIYIRVDLITLEFNFVLMGRIRGGALQRGIVQILELSGQLNTEHSSKLWINFDSW